MMTSPVNKKVKVLEADYIEKAQSILIVGECEEGRLRTHIHRNCFLYGNRNEEQIKIELHKTAKMMVGKTINMVFDVDVDGKIKDGAKLEY